MLCSVTEHIDPHDFTEFLNCRTKDRSDDVVLQFGNEMALYPALSLSKLF